jgi:hypothetical protein
MKEIATHLLLLSCSQSQPCHSPSLLTLLTRQIFRTRHEITELKSSKKLNSMLQGRCYLCILVYISPSLTLTRRSTTCTTSNSIEATHPSFAHPTPHPPCLSSFTSCALRCNGAQMLEWEVLLRIMTLANPILSSTMTTL